MNKKLTTLLWTGIIWISSFLTPMLTTASNFEKIIDGGVWINVGWNQQGAWTWFISFVQNGVNWILWILGLITVVIIIWWGFQMVTAAWDDTKYKKWFTIVKQAAIWLVLIGVSWLIVSLVFHFVWSTADTATNANVSN